MSITFADRIANLRKALARDPTVDELLDAAQIHQMTLEEILAQAKSYLGEMSARCEHDELDFEQCAESLRVRRSPRC